MSVACHPRRLVDKLKPLSESSRQSGGFYRSCGWTSRRGLVRLHVFACLFVVCLPVCFRVHLIVHIHRSTSQFVDRLQLKKMPAVVMLDAPSYLLEPSQTLRYKQVQQLATGRSRHAVGTCVVGLGLRLLSVTRFVALCAAYVPFARFRNL